MAKFITISFLTAYVGLYDKWHTYKDYVKSLLASKQDEEKKEKERQLAGSNSKWTVMEIHPNIDDMADRHSKETLEKTSSEESLIFRMSPVNENENTFLAEKKEENEPGPSDSQEESSNGSLASNDQSSPSKSKSLLDIYTEDDIDYYGIDFGSIDLSSYPINDDVEVDAPSCIHDPDTSLLLAKKNPLWNEKNAKNDQESPENLLSTCIPMFDLEENIDAAIQLELCSRSFSQAKNKNN